MALTGRVLYPDDKGWDEARKGFNARINYDAEQPQAIVFCQHATDVANAVNWARENHVPLRVRSGRHAYEGYSSRVRKGVIIDVSEMDSVHIDGTTATLGAGLEMLKITEALWEKGVTIPLATGSTVSIAGLTLGGGFGVTTRGFGLTCDNLVDVEMVTAEGQIIHVNDNDNAELSWACKGGGGGNFGIATSFTFKTHPVAYVAVFNIAWEWDRFVDIVDFWQHWAPAADDRLSSFLRLAVDRTIRLIGQFTAEPQDLLRVHSLLEPAIRLGPTYVSIQIVPFIMAARIFFGKDPLRPHWAVQVHSDREIYKSTSALAYDPFNGAAIQTLRARLEAVPDLVAPPPEVSMVQLLAGGGAPGRVAPDRTAAVHRNAKFIVQYNSYWAAPPDGRKTMDWIVDFRDSMTPHTRGAYVNYFDETITNWEQEYYGSNLSRLKAVKNRYDPNNLFNFPQSIRP